jgi:tetratricopeptide (TPR) repeat protein
MSQERNSSTGKTITIRGRRVALGKRLAIASRSHWKRLIKQHGGYPVDHLDDHTDVLLVGDDWDAAIGNGVDSKAVGGHGGEGRPQKAAAGASLDCRNQALNLVAEVDLWQSLTGDLSPVDVSRFYTPQMLAGLLDVSVATIRRWHRRGLIVPVHHVNKLPYFDFQEIASARRIARWIQDGKSPAVIERQLAEIADAGGNHRPLSQLSIIVQGQQVLLRAGEGLTSATGQLHFDFDADVVFDPSRITLDRSIPPLGGITADDPDDLEPGPLSSVQQRGALTTVDRPSVLPFVKFDDFASDEFDKTPDQFIAWATELEDGGDCAAALDVYRAMTLAHGPTPDVSFRIAELLYQLGDLSAARERYYFAIEMDETFVEARASLGCVLAEQGKQELALAAFRGALDYHLDFADVHFHIARLLDEMGRPDQAITHWGAFLQLAPKSPWAQEAQLRLAEEE